jgi:hypothetical protein
MHGGLLYPSACSPQPPCPLVSCDHLLWNLSRIQGSYDSEAELVSVHLLGACSDSASHRHQDAHTMMLTASWLEMRSHSPVSECGPSMYYCDWCVCTDGEQSPVIRDKMGQKSGHVYPFIAKCLHVQLCVTCELTLTFCSTPRPVHHEITDWPCEYNEYWKEINHWLKNDVYFLAGCHV